MKTVNLGAPYEKIINDVIRQGYAGTQVEVMRQALMSYWQNLTMAKESEELRLVRKGVAHEMAKVRSGKVKLHDLRDVIKELER